MHSATGAFGDARTIMWDMYSFPSWILASIFIFEWNKRLNFKAIILSRIKRFESRSIPENLNKDRWTKFWCVSKFTNKTWTDLIASSLWMPVRERKVRNKVRLTHILTMDNWSIKWIPKHSWKMKAATLTSNTKAGYQIWINITPVQAIESMIKCCTIWHLSA